MKNTSGITKDVSSITNSAVMAVDAVMRKNGVPIEHNEVRALLEVAINSAVANHNAVKAQERLDELVGVATTS